MSGPGGKRSLRDEDLVAYLDGELAPADRAQIEQQAATDERVAARLAALRGQPADLRQAFAPLLLEAPTLRLRDMLDALDVAGPRRRAVSGTKYWTRRELLAASVALLMAGGLADHALGTVSRALLPQDPGHWRDIVAGYVRLYTPETLSDIPNNPSLRAHELAEVGSMIGLRLDPAAVGLPGSVLKSAQILQYDATPLAEINYLDGNGAPLALCIIPSGQPAKGPRLELRRGLNVAFWNDGHHGFMVIGRQPPADLAKLAQSLAGRINAA
jgi:anti-sigma factor RsiW